MGTAKNSDPGWCEYSYESRSLKTIAHESRLLGLSMVLLLRRSKWACDSSVWQAQEECTMTRSINIHCKNERRVQITSDYLGV
eukprot:6190552-Pleurochrysis_carterae.AAC.1